MALRPRKHMGDMCLQQESHRGGGIVMDGAGIGAVLTGAAALITALAGLIRELRRHRPPTSPEDTSEDAPAEP
jgi:hypothetical protein